MILVPPPRYFDARNLVVLWREALLAQKALAERIHWINQNAEAVNDERPMLNAAEPKPKYGQ